MGRADDKEGEALSSEPDDDKDKDYSDKDPSDTEDLDVESKKKYKCTEPGCTARFLRPSRLTWHLRKHNDERPYKCSIKGCTRAYTNSSHLKRHENTHKPITTTYTCSECLLEVGSLFSLKRHCKMIHDPKRLTCADCGAKFRKKHCYNEHLSMHAGISMYKCEVCQVECPTLRLLKKHQLSHEKKKTYACKAPGCTKVFDKWSKLAKHVETDHQFEQKCDQCDKSFKTKRQLDRHLVLHEKEGIFSSCPYPNCPRFYAHEKNLDEHVRSFHEGRRFICDTCNSELTSKASLIRHIKKCHEEQIKPLKKSTRSRKRRKDNGLAKTSMAIRLAGIKIPQELEKDVLKRKPEIDLQSPLEMPGGSEAKSSKANDVKDSEMETISRKALSEKVAIGFDSVTECFVSLEKICDPKDPTEMQNKRICVEKKMSKSIISETIEETKKQTENRPRQSIISGAMENEEINVSANSPKPIIPEAMEMDEITVEDNSSRAGTAAAMEEEKTSEKQDFYINEQTDEELLSSVDCFLKSGELIVLQRGSEDFSELEEDNTEILMLAEQLLQQDANFVADPIAEQPLLVYEETEFLESTNDPTKIGKIDISIKPLTPSFELSEQIFPVNSETGF